MVAILTRNVTPPRAIERDVAVIRRQEIAALSPAAIALLVQLRLDHAHGEVFHPNPRGGSWGGYRLQSALAELRESGLIEPRPSVHGRLGLYVLATAMEGGGG